MTWMNGLRATFDLETTGVDVTTARIVTASLILLDPQGNVVRRGEWLADPSLRSPPVPPPCTVLRPSTRVSTAVPPARSCGSLPERLVR